MEGGNLSNVTFEYKCIPGFSPLLIGATVVFTAIFLLSVIGNSLVIVTIVQNRRMRTPTNMFLLSLALSDLLLSVICMPPTLTGLLFRCYFYGPFMCRLTTYLQPLSVTASSHTLVVIAVERYYAICKPLQSRKWQTRRHCVKMICTVWAMSMFLNLPYIIYAKVVYIGGKVPNCIADFPHDDFKKYYWLVLGIILFVLPSIIMTFLYVAVIRTLYLGIADDSAAANMQRSPEDDTTEATAETSVSASISQRPVRSESTVKRINLRSTHSHRNLVAKKKVIRMLAAIVVEFNICWTPLFFYHTLVYFFKPIRYEATLTVVFLSLAYLSACCNPLTYCFMNKKFRTAFQMAFGCGNKADLNGTSFYQSTYHHARYMQQLQHRCSLAERRLIVDSSMRDEPKIARNGEPTQLKLRKLTEEEESG